MLYWTTVFKVIAVVAGLLGFTGIAGTAAEQVKSNIPDLDQYIIQFQTDVTFERLTLNPEPICLGTMSAYVRARNTACQ